MAKRTATSNLNRDNWNEDETPEEMGVFQKASPNELKMRAIKRAKRRGVGSEDEGISIFKNFKAFGASNAEPVTPTFSFLSEDSEKPKLTNPNPFPSFSFNKLSNSSKTISDEPLDAVKTSTAKDTTPSITLNSTSDSKSSKEALNPVSNKDENESVPKSLTFNFSVGSNKLMNNSSSATLPAFNFNTTKNFDSLPKQQPAGESIFKFGNDFKESEPSKTTTTPLFQFGIQATTKSNCEHPSSSLSSKSDNLKETQANNLKETSQSSKVNGMESNTDSASSKSTIFLAYLKALNLGVLSWVKQHLDKNQYINLTPIFNDYNKHLQEIKTKYSPNLEKGAKETAFASEKTKGNTEETGSCDTLQKSVQPESFPKTTSSTPPTSLFRFGSSNSKWNKKEAFVFGGQSVSSPSNIGSTGTKTCDTNKTVEVKPFTFGISNSSPNSNASSQKTPSNESTNKTSTPLFSFGIKDKQTPSFAFGSKENKSTFSFGSSDGSSKISGFSFGVPKDKSTGFTFEPSSNSSSGFSFKVDSSNLKSPSSNNTEKKENEEEEASDEVPKVEVNEVKEEDAIYEKKVKLFYKKEDKYVDKGIGTLFLKPAGEKTQLLIRALTNLGNILLNIILNESIPTQRVGKNNVLLVCVPNPPIDPKSSAPVSLLIRVKTEADADEMLEKINEHKK